MNVKRKNRSTSARSPRSRGNERSSLSLDGVYNNSYFMNSVTSLIGNTMKVHTSTGAIFEGIFRTFSAQFEIVLELAHKVDSANPYCISVDSIADTIIFRAQDITKVEITDADMEYATRDAFQTDTAISKFNGQITEKELEPWDCSGNNVDDCELDGTTSNGWDVNDMFRQNEQMYGVTSNFDHGLSAYTTPLKNKDSKDYKDAEMKAAKIACEIESNPTYKARIDVENGDEEEKFASVVRPSSEAAQLNSEGGKYVCPPKRKNVQQGIKPVRTPPVVSPQNSLSNGSANAKLSPTSSNFPQHHCSLAHNATNSRDRVNGISESPKPQRTTINTRHARSFGSSEISRCNGQISHVAPSVQSNPGNNTVIETRNPSTATHNNNSISTNYNNNINNNISNNTVVYATNGISSSVESHHRKPPIHQPEIQNTSLSVSRKISRGRDDQIIELKKFGAEFKLNENTEDKKHIGNEHSTDSEHNHTQSHPNTRNDKTDQMSQVSTSSRSPDSTDGKHIKSKLNPNAKEFVYNPNAKPFTPRSVSTPTQSRPHTPQTPGYGGPVPPMPTMVMPTYVVTTAQPPYSQQPNQTSRYRKVHMGMSQPSQMQVAAATGQPLLAPAPIHTQYGVTVPYSPQPHIAPQPYQQMVRMVAQQGGGMVPPVLTAINYPPDGSAPSQMQYMGPGALGPHPHHPHHVHPSNSNTTPSPQGNGGGSMGPAGGGGGGSSGGSTTGGPPPNYSSSPASYSQPPPSSHSHPSNPPHSFPLLCPMLPAPPPPPHPGSHNPHHMIAAAAAPSSVQSYIHHHHPHQHTSSVGNQQQGHHIQVILPHSQ